MKRNYIHKKWINVLLFILLIVFGILFIKPLKERYISITSNKTILRVKLINVIPGCKLMSMLKEILEERYHILYTDKNYDLVFEDVYGEDSAKNYQGIKIFFTIEAAIPPVLEEYDLVMGFDNKVDNSHYMRLPYYYLTSKQDITYSSNMRARFGECNPYKEAFACFLVTNDWYGVNYRIGNGKLLDGVPVRISLFQTLSEYKKVESGGKAFNNIGYIIPMEDTASWLGKCKFVIAYENQMYDGYITEKAFNAYFAGAVPIWYGSESAAQDINTKAIIYANEFNNENELVEYIKKIDNDDKLYCDIWNENILKEDARSYDQVYQELRERVFKILDKKLNK